MTNHVRPDASGNVHVTPQSAGWHFLSFQILNLQPNEVRAGESGALEVAFVPQSGTLEVVVAGQRFVLTRQDVFSEKPSVLYLPPGTAYTLTAKTVCTVAFGGAPAEGTLPIRLIGPSEMRTEMRGGANATRQVNHILGPDLPAERLLLYEVYTPSGNWSGWPPHRHDGRLGSFYIEETYHYRIRPENGWAVHRNYSPEDHLDELLLAKDGDVILAPKGYHPVGASPGSNVYYLNFMAGDAVGEERRVPAVDEPQWAYMRSDWTGRAMPLPFGEPSDGAP